MADQADDHAGRDNDGHTGSAHGGGHEDAHGGEALGPVDLPMWGAAVLGIALGLVVVVALVWALT